MSYYLFENNLELLVLIKKIIDFHIAGSMSADEVFYLLDALLVPEMRKRCANGDPGGDLFGELDMELSYYEPNPENRKECDLYFDQTKLTEILRDFLPKINNFIGM